METPIQSEIRVEQRYDGKGPHGGDIDEAYLYMQDAKRHDDVEMSPGEIKRLRRKIDWWIVPIMLCCYTMQFIDKVSLNVGYLITVQLSLEHHIYNFLSMPLSWDSIRN
jgi:hypothetical protein